MLPIQTDFSEKSLILQKYFERWAKVKPVPLSPILPEWSADLSMSEVMGDLYAQYAREFHDDYTVEVK